MPTFEEHRQKCDIAKSTQLTLQAADPHEHADWIVITAFYQALHWREDNPDLVPFFLGSFNSSGGARCPAYDVGCNLPSTRQNRSKNGKLNSPTFFLICIAFYRRMLYTCVLPV